MISVVPGRDRTHRWRLVSRTEGRADVLAEAAEEHRTGDPRGPIPPAGHHHPAPWLHAVEQLRDGDGVVDVLATSDGHFRWRLTAPDGTVVAESPAVHRDEASCHEAFRAAQDAARMTLGERDRELPE